MEHVPTYPSEADIEMTFRTMGVCKTLGTVVRGHLIVGRNGDLSFRTGGPLKELAMATGCRRSAIRGGFVALKMGARALRGIRPRFSASAAAGSGRFC